MSAGRKISVVLLGFTLAWAFVPPAGAALGSRIKVHPHVTAHGYSRPEHHVRGRVGIDNRSGHTVTVKCLVVARLDGSGSTHKKGSAVAKARVPSHATRRPHFSIKIHDTDHHLNNVPSHIATHCQRV